MFLERRRVADLQFFRSRCDPPLGHGFDAVVVRYYDTRQDRKVHALTADRCVVLTPGSVPTRPFQHAIELDAVDALVTETAHHQQHMIDAITAYSVAHTRSRDLVVPDFPSAPQPPHYDPDDPKPSALRAADYAAGAWSAWLATEEQRRRRAVNPRTGASPWIMPPDLASTVIADLPPAFAEQAQPEPLG